jgi:phosphoadenosine phosphosulfate reductase
MRESAADAGYVSVSWGKDSVVLAHMASVVCPKLPLVWIKVLPIYNPECEIVRDVYNRTGLQTYEEITVACTLDETGWHATGTLECGVQEASRRHGKLAMTGVRAEESSSRYLRVWTHGITTRATVCPLAYLTAKDVFAILYAKNLPVHPAYAMNGGGRWTRQQLRVASLGGARGEGHGRSQWEREYYGDVLGRIESHRMVRK